MESSRSQSHSWLFREFGRSVRIREAFDFITFLLYFDLWVTVITIYHLASLLMPNRAKFLHIDNIYKRSSSVFHGRCSRTKIIIPAIGASNLVIGILLAFFPYNSIEFGNDAETRIILKYECTDAVSFGYIESSF